MLHEDVLIILRYLAHMTRGAIVEFGSYVGGSTIALAQGIRHKRPFVSVELGGAHSHPVIGSDDIFADLQRNVRDSGVTGKVALINADARAPATKDAIRRAIGSKKIGLLVVDTDGLVDRDLAIYAPLCARGCILVLDDYVATDTASGLAHTYPGYSPHKSDIVRETVDRMVAAGEVIPFGVYGWGTWIGRTC